MNLPDYRERSSDLAERMRKQLQGSGSIIKVCQFIVGGLLPIVEGVLINLATGTEGGARTAYIATLIIIGLFHAVLLIILLSLETPLPQFLVQFDEQAKSVLQAQAEAETFKLYSTTFIEAITATQFSMVEIENMKHTPEKELDIAFKRVLTYWIDRRTNIFWFHDGDALYNFAVYLESKPDLMTMKYRSHDSRMVTTNRSWKKNDGHVGKCFERKETIFLSLRNGALDGVQDLIKTSQSRLEDREYYNSMMATPIMIRGEAKGVFIITSSKSDQFVKELHTSIMGVIGMLLAQALENYREDENGKNTT